MVQATIDHLKCNKFLDYNSLELYGLNLYLMEMAAIDESLSESIIQIVNELQYYRFENKMLDVGIIFTSNFDKFKLAYHQTVVADFSKPIIFDEISKIKNVLPVTDGLYSFLVVDKKNMKIKGHMTSLIPFHNLIASSDDFKKAADKNDLILSIRNGVVKLLKGDDTYKTVEIFEKVRNELKIRSTSVYREQVCRIIKNIMRDVKFIDDFIDTVFELSRLGKGTIFVLTPENSDLDGLKDGYEINDMSLQNELKLIDESNRGKYKTKYFEKIKQMAKTDGAIIVDGQMSVVRFGATINNNTKDEPDQTRVGGKKHISSKNFSKSNEQILVVTISDDGPISIFSKGERVLRV